MAVRDAEPVEVDASNSTALVTALQALTGLRDEHAALVEHAKTLAALVDLVPGEPKFHAEYRAALTKLVELGAPAAVDDAQRVLDQIRGAG